eukprot:9150407-Ditylum_brightwellii.AAC.1
MESTMLAVVLEMLAYCKQFHNYIEDWDLSQTTTVVCVMEGQERQFRAWKKAFRQTDCLHCFRCQSNNNV